MKLEPQTSAPSHKDQAPEKFNKEFCLVIVKYSSLTPIIFGMDSKKRPRSRVSLEQVSNRVALSPVMDLRHWPLT